MLLPQCPNMARQSHICVNDGRTWPGTADNGIEAGEFGVPLLFEGWRRWVEVRMVDGEDGHVGFKEGDEEGDDVVGEGVVGVEEEDVGHHFCFCLSSPFCPLSRLVRWLVGVWFLPFLVPFKADSLSGYTLPRVMNRESSASLRFRSAPFLFHVFQVLGRAVKRKMVRGTPPFLPSFLASFLFCFALSGFRTVRYRTHGKTSVRTPPHSHPKLKKR